MYEWFTIDQAADHIGFDPDTLHDLVRAGWIHHLVIDGDVLICDLTLDDLRFELRTLADGN